MRKRSLMCCVSMLVVMATAVSAWAQNDEAQTLTGINALAVVVEDLNDAAKSMGLTTDAIRADIEQKLRLAGLHTVTTDDVAGLAGAPHLYVNVTAAAEAAYVHVEFRQNAVLERNDAAAYAITTWQTGYLQMRPTVQSVRDGVEGRIDEFLSDWRSVNPGGYTNVSARGRTEPPRRGAIYGARNSSHAFSAYP